MRELFLHLWHMLVALWQVPEAQLLLLLDRLMPQVLFLVCAWLVVRWMYKKMAK